jgi:hypothetical protein
MIRTDPALTKLRRQKRKAKAKLLGLPPRRKRKHAEDEAYQSWVRTLPCCVCNAPPPSESCHVRRASRSGTGFKGWMCSVPMCHACHSAQHASLARGSGEGLCLNTRLGLAVDAEFAKRWFDERLKELLERWEAMQI